MVAGLEAQLAARYEQLAFAEDGGDDGAVRQAQLGKRATGSGVAGLDVEVETLYGVGVLARYGAGAAGDPRLAVAALTAPAPAALRWIRM